MQMPVISKKPREKTTPVVVCPFAQPYMTKHSDIIIDIHGHMSRKSNNNYKRKKQS